MGVLLPFTHPDMVVYFPLSKDWNHNDGLYEYRKWVLSPAGYSQDNIIYGST